MINIFIPAVLCFLVLSSCVSITPSSFRILDIAEPSGISYSPTDGTLYIVSDNGILYQTDMDGKNLRVAERKGVDYEAVCVVGSSVYVMDESVRQIVEYDRQELKVKRILPLVYQGAQNRGFESLVYLPDQEQFIAITEKSPVLVYRMDRNFNVLTIMEPKWLYEISDACYFKGELYLLSDEDDVLYRVDPKDFTVKDRWTLNIRNPEGLAFTDDEMLIMSDDMETLFRFTMPEEGTK